MRVRNGFVSNSSSTAFIITNLTDRPLTVVDFVRENSHLIEEFREEYDWHDAVECCQRNLLLSAEQNNETLNPGENYCVFGDEDGTLIGLVFDYILRDGGESKSFQWRFCEYRR